MSERNICKIRVVRLNLLPACRQTLTGEACGEDLRSEGQRGCVRAVFQDERENDRKQNDEKDAPFHGEIVTPGFTESTSDRPPDLQTLRP